jgi:hypothetical protein
MNKTGGIKMKRKREYVILALSELLFFLILCILDTIPTERKLDLLDKGMFLGSPIAGYIAYRVNAWRKAMKG